MSRRREFLAASVLGLGGLTVAGCARPLIHGQHGLSENTEGLTPAAALTRLTDGNARFVAMKEQEPNNSTKRLMAVAGGQHPFVGMLGCVDSRVPPELVFDRGLGDIFDARIAGAVADDAAVGSLEFGVDEFDVPLLVVMGHSRCGAVTAAAKALESAAPAPPGRIGSVVEPILPSVKAAKAQGLSGVTLIDAAARDVVNRGVSVLQSSPVLTGRIASGALKVVGAFYDLDSGKVEFLAAR